MQSIQWYIIEDTQSPNPARVLAVLVTVTPISLYIRLVPRALHVWWSLRGDGSIFMSEVPMYRGTSLIRNPPRTLQKEHA